MIEGRPSHPAQRETPAGRRHAQTLDRGRVADRRKAVPQNRRLQRPCEPRARDRAPTPHPEKPERRSPPGASTRYRVTVKTRRDRHQTSTTIRATSPRQPPSETTLGAQQDLRTEPLAADTAEPDRSGKTRQTTDTAEGTVNHRCRTSRPSAYRCPEPSESPSSGHCGRSRSRGSHRPAQCRWRRRAVVRGGRGRVR
jgi:hypothetical protein